MVVGLALPGCGDDAATAKGWRDIDLCALVDKAQVEALSYNSSGDVTAPQRVDRTKTAAADVDSIGCRWGDYVTVSLTDRNYGPDSPVRRMEPAMLPVLRTMDVAGKSALVTEEKGGTCNASVFYDDARLSVTIAPATTKRTVDLDDTSTASCDAQQPLIKSILDRVKLS
ncbi:hypothetical protein DFR70_101943 [Nocardia tenerifensis]|uniref:DUF3558 domain-containing protein n=1 Tax=Nocardia tenerifensis TaxID=228006 RepID=A0A318KF92_9NOCA|nr:hypothetical protein DFR70_101943 [Nocardia tenerifensis]